VFQDETRDAMGRSFHLGTCDRKVKLSGPVVLKLGAGRPPPIPPSATDPRCRGRCARRPGRGPL